jgi:hypothetical protein
VKSDTINFFLSRVIKLETKLPFSAKCRETKQQYSQWNNQDQWLSIQQAIEKSVLAVLSAVAATLNLLHKLRMDYFEGVSNRCNKGIESVHELWVMYPLKLSIQILIKHLVTILLH